MENGFNVPWNESFRTSVSVFYFEEPSFAEAPQPSSKREIIVNSGSQPKFVYRWEPTELASTILSAPSREVVSHWISALAFLDQNLHPVLLAVNNQSEPTFNQLVQAVNPGFAQSVVLNELLRKGIVEQLDSDHVLLRRCTYVHDVPSFEISPKVRRQTHSPGRSVGRRQSDEV